MERLRIKQTESIRHSELLSSACSFDYTLRHLWAAEGQGPLDKVLDPFTRETLQSGENAKIYIEKAAFSIPEDPTLLRKLCHTYGETAPISAEDIPRFVEDKIKGITDSTGKNTHFENATVLGILFPTPENKEQIITFINKANAPEKPNSCSEIEGTLNGQEVSYHLHAAYEGNNKRVVTMFALLGHEPSLALLAKWVEKDFVHEHGNCNHDHHSNDLNDHDSHHSPDEHSAKKEVHQTKRFQGPPKNIASQMAVEIISRKEKEQSQSIEIENAIEMTSEERIDSVASVTFARVVDEENKEIEDAFEQVTKNKYVGQIELGQKEAAPVTLENKVLTENFEKTLQIFRAQLIEQNQPDVDSEKMALRLAQLHDQSINQKDLKKIVTYPPSNNKEATVLLALAIEIKTRANKENLSENETQILESAERLQKDFGVHFINYTTDHKSNYHKIVQPNGSIVSCPEHAKETQALDQKLQKSHETAREQIKNIFLAKQARTSQLQNQQRTRSRGAYQKNKSEQTLPKTTPALEILSVMGNKDASRELLVSKEKHKLEKRYGAVAIAAIAIAAEIPIDEEMREPASNDFTGWGNFAEKPTDEAKAYNASITPILAAKVKEVRIQFVEEKNIDIAAEKVVASLEALHNQPIDKEKQQAFIKKFADPKMTLEIFEQEIPGLPHEAFVEIFTKAMEIETRPKEKPLTPYENKIIQAKNILNKQDKYFANKINTNDHSGWFHGNIRLVGGVPVMDECPDHTPASEKKLKNIRQEIEKAIQKSLPNKQNLQSIKPKELYRPRGGGNYNEEPKKPKSIEQIIPRLSPARSNEIRRQPKPPALRRTEQRIPIRFQTEARAIQDKKRDEGPAPKKRLSTKVYIKETAGSIGIRPKDVQFTKNPIDADSTVSVGTGFKKPKVSPIAGTPYDISLTQLTSEASIDPKGTLRTVAVVAPTPKALSLFRPSLSEFAKTTARVQFSSSAERSTSVSRSIRTKSTRSTSTGSTIETASSSPMLRTIATSKPDMQPGIQSSSETISAVAVGSSNTSEFASPRGSQPNVRLVHTSTNSPDQSPISAPNTVQSISTETVAPIPQSNTVNLKETTNGKPRASLGNVTVVSEGKAASTVGVVPKNPIDNVTYVNFAEGNGNTADSLPKGTKTTTDSTKATASVTVRRAKGKEKQVDAPSAPRPSNTLNPNDEVASTVSLMKKVDGAKTTVKLQEAFAQKTEKKVEEQVAEQMQQASGEVKQEATNKQTTQNSVHHEQTVTASETERVTRIQVAPGVERFGTEKISQSKTKTSRQEEETEEKKTTTAQEITDQDTGTNEIAHADQSATPQQVTQA
ncbi:MAG: hypothetical protein H0W89_05865, partial [Candidatus Levybacteria bacterium]|nr:hypothetical protein [Candidatus Levybacteria bacterium]